MLIYDTGSGTFDVSLLTMEDDIFEVKTIAGHMGKLNDKPSTSMMRRLQPTWWHRGHQLGGI